MKRRTLVAQSLLLAALPWTAQAQQKFPSGPIRLLVPFPPGGATDILARRIATRLAEILGGTIVVENRPGGGGTIAGAAVAAAPPDGYTLLVGGLELATNPALIGTKILNPQKDLTPIGGLTLGTFVLAVNPAKNNFANLQELLAAAKARPGELTYGSAGAGNVTHLFGEIFKRTAQVDIRHIPYRGAAPAIADLQGGQITMMFASRATARPLVTSGHLRALAITGKEPHASFPGVRTFEQQGIPMPEADLGAWTGLFGPAGMPRELVTTLNQALNQALGTPALKETLSQIGLEVDPSSPEALGQRVVTQTEKWTQLIRAANITAD